MDFLHVKMFVKALFGRSVSDLMVEEIKREYEKKEPEDKLAETTENLTFQYFNRFTPKALATKLILTYESENHPFPPKLYLQTSDTVIPLEFDRLKNEDYDKLASLSADLNMKHKGNIEKIDHIYQTILAGLVPEDCQDCNLSADFKIEFDKDFTLQK